MRRPRWSLKTNFQVGVALLLVIIPLILLYVEASIWVRLELVTGVVAVLLFAYLWIVLYLGVRFDRKERYEFRWRGRSLSDFSEPVYYMGDTGGVFSLAGMEAGPVGCLIGLLLDLIATILLSFGIAVLFWLGVNLVVGAVTAVFIPLYFLFSRSLRFIVTQGRHCRGNLGRSFVYALSAAAVCATWFFLTLNLARFFVMAMRGTGA